MSMSSPYVLLPYQQRWINDNSNVKIAEKSRRIGITWAEAADDALLAATTKQDGGMDVLYIGYNKEMAQEFIEEVANWAKHYKYAAEAVEEFIFKDQGTDKEERDILAFKIRFASGNEVVALSSRPNNLRGRQGKVVIDEAAFHDNLAELLKAAMALLMWGGRVVIISTHDGVDNYFNELIQLVREKRKNYSLHTITLDDAIADGLYQRICLVQGKDWSLEAQNTWKQGIINDYGDDADEELFCIPKRSGGAYLTYEMIDACMEDGIPIVRWQQNDSFAQLAEHLREAACKEWCEDTLKPLLMQLKPALRSSFGEDFGRSGDLTVIWPLQLQANMRRHTPFTVELRNIPFEQQKQILFYIVDRLPRLGKGLMDAGGNGSFLAEVAEQRYGQGVIEKIKFTNDWYREHTPIYKAALEDQMMTLPRHSDVMADHRAFTMVDGVAKIPTNKRTKGTDDKKRHGDSAIAGLLAYIASREVYSPIEFQAVGAVRETTTYADYMGDMS
ncbi:MAG: terminase family protein [Alphaproteobacteria bacterium]|nr:terminase family protein [Alphaproteobacteria bacterium]MDD9919766.1 terminase family protein [Alphaproteobacteria bacterium]